MMAKGSGVDIEVKALCIWRKRKKNSEENENIVCTYNINIKKTRKWQSWRVEKRVRETKIPSQLCVPLPRTIIAA